MGAIGTPKCSKAGFVHGSCKQTNKGAKRASTFFTVDWDFGHGVIKNRELNSRSVKAVTEPVTPVQEEPPVAAAIQRSPLSDPEKLIDSEYLDPPAAKPVAKEVDGNKEDASEGCATAEK